jgi:hypothetical protein
MRPTPTPGAASTPTPTKAAHPFPFNTGTPLAANCSSPLLAQRRVYAQQQVQTAYGIDTLRAHASGTPVITVLDLGGGWLPDDLELAGQCFGYSPPDITQTQGDGVAAPIGNADDETSLDLQTVGGTSGSTPFVAAATALVVASERQAGRPRVGLAKGWLYKAATTATRPSAFFDVTQGNNDLAGVGCCQATVGYDPVSGLGVPNWATLSATLPKPG